MRARPTLLLAFASLAALAVACGDDDGDSGSPAPPTPAPVELALQWDGAELSRLHLRLTPHDIPGAEPLEVDALDLQAERTSYSVDLELLPGSWEVAVDAYVDDEVVATGEASFEVVSGEAITVTLTLRPTGEEVDPPGDVTVTVNLCVHSPVASLLAMREGSGADAREGRALRVVVRLLPDAGVEALVALISWGPDGEGGEAELMLEPVEGQAEVWEGSFVMEDPDADHTVTLVVNGAPVCLPEGG